MPAMVDQAEPSTVPLRIRLVLQGLLFPAIVGAIIFGAAGRLDIWSVWGVLGVLAAFTTAGAILGDPSLYRERRAPGPGNQDRLTRVVGGPLLLAHWVVAGLDLGRFEWSPVAPGLRVAGIAIYAVCMAVLLWAMTVNRFYSSVVRVQSDRGHQPITSGPYRWVRHPGYAASILGALSGAIGIGSWLGVVPLVIFGGVFARRLLLEDRMLRRDLPGYEEYAGKVRFRLVPGIF
jgi:protein-S-isoprenylcysteine O-methyltransferase Ste14